MGLRMSFTDPELFEFLDAHFQRVRTLEGFGIHVSEEEYKVWVSMSPEPDCLEPYEEAIFVRYFPQGYSTVVFEEFRSEFEAHRHVTRFIMRELRRWSGLRERSGSTADPSKTSWCPLVTYGGHLESWSSQIESRCFTYSFARPLMAVEIAKCKVLMDTLHFASCAEISMKC